MLIFLSLNDIELEYAQDDLVSIILDAANGNADASNLFQWLREHRK